MNNSYNLSGGLTIPSSIELPIQQQVGLESSLLQAQIKLQSFAHSSTFTEHMVLAFGDTANVSEFQAAWQAGDLEIFSGLDIRTGAELNGAFGAYAEARDTIYLSQDLLAAGNVDQITGVLLEELGHRVDSRLNLWDSTGDEGAIFSALVQMQHIADDTLTALRAKQDQIVLELDGSVILAEAAADTVSLIQDIRTGSNGSSPSNLISVRDTLFFTADDGTTGRELWKSDGTQTGTVLVQDINPSGNASVPNDLTVVGDTLFFSANDGTTGRELWKSDGTQAGTVLVKDIRTGSSDSFPTNLTAVGNTLFFGGFDDTNGSELWKSDGTEAGTVLIKDINPSRNSSTPSELTAVGNTLFFMADDGTNGSQLWKSDGTEAGTVLVKDISVGGIANALIAVGNTLFFRAFDDTNGVELWKSDGTEAGTVLVKDINPGSGDSIPINFTVVGDTLFFSANGGTNGAELWKSDGTEAGTVLIKDIRIGSSGSFPANLTAVGDTLFFGAFDDTNGSELWKSDGTEAGTVLVKDLVKDIAPIMDSFPISGSSPSELTIVGDTLFFTANDDENGRDLWKTDGTEAGTVLVRDINPESIRSRLSNLTAVGDKLFFNANDNINGSELWKLETNNAPVVSNPLPDVNIDTNQAINIVLPADTFSDADGDALTLTAMLSSGAALPDWLSFDGVAFIGTPPQNFTSSLDLQVTASDGALSAVDSFTLTINAVNAAPTALTLENIVTALVENTDTTSRIKIADIVITDDGRGINAITLSGADASLFEVAGEVLYLKAGTAIDFETKSNYNIIVEVDDVTVGSSPDLSQSVTLFVTNIPEGNDGDDVLNGSKGNDVLNGGKGDDALNGGKGKDQLNGGRGRDVLKGGKGNDVLNGGRGRDVLKGGKGRDRLKGGKGDDILTGGKGKDTFIFSSAFGCDVITDFKQGADLLDLRAFNLTGINDLTIEYGANSQQNIHITSSANDFGQITLRNFTGVLTECDFIF